MTANDFRNLLLSLGACKDAMAWSKGKGYNVFSITGIDSRIRILQSTGAECIAFARGYITAVSDWEGVVIECKYFECDAGDASVLPWKTSVLS